MANKGDKFILEIGETLEKANGKLYRVKGFSTLVLDEYGLGKLEPYIQKAEEVPEIIEGFAELARLLAAGEEIKAGQKVDCYTKDGDTLEWVVIETRPEVAGMGRVMVAQRTVTRYDAFSYVSKEHPLGYNDYAVSKARDILKRDYFEALQADDLAVVIPRRLFVGSEDQYLFWLLDKDEVAGESAFEWYKDKEHRIMKDYEGDYCRWFLRGPTPSNANGVRIVSTGGNLSGSYASLSSGFVAACVIEYRNILPA